MICALLYSAICHCQSTSAMQDTLRGRIIDGESDQPIAFAVILQQGTSNGTFSDIDGHFQLAIESTSNSILIQCVGYITLELQRHEANGLLRLFPDHIALKEVVIRPGINPAERIIRAAIANKDINHPEKGGGFTYESYNRLVFGAQLDSNLVHQPDSLAKQDSSVISMYEFFNQQYLFLMETVSKRKFLPPHFSEETILANRVSGLKNTDFFVLATNLQSFSFYGEEVSLLSNQYMSPLANNSISKYLFILENTSVLQQDTVWTISYRPRKNKNFDGMEGLLFINSRSYAIQQVTASPLTSGPQKIKIQQQYQLIENRRWFPIQLNATIVFNGMMINNVPMVGDGKSYIRNIHLDPPLKASEFSPIVLMMDKNASLSNDSIWSVHRPDSISIKEITTYHVIDSIGQANHFDKKVKLLESLAIGKWRLGKLDLDIKRLLAFNNFEGFRLGAGLHTNEELFKHVTLGGYYAYGLQDRGHKYGGDAILHLHRKRGIELKAEYYNDLIETGGHQLDKIDPSFFFFLYPIFVSRMDRCEVKELSLKGRWWSNLSGIAALSQRFVKSFATYNWYPITTEQITLSQNQFSFIESSITLRYAPGEKLIRMGQREVSMGSKWPILTARLANSGSIIKWGDLQYNRMDLNLSKVFYILNIGELTAQLYGGKITGDAPAPLLYNARGTYDRFTIAVNNTFETMRTNEFMHDTYAAIHIRHNFKHLLFRRPKFEPQLIISQSSLFGSLNKPNDHSVPLKAASLGYHETGLSINNLIKSNLSSLGLGVFYRYGPYHLDTMRDNFAFKLTSTITF